MEIRNLQSKRFISLAGSKGWDDWWDTSISTGILLSMFGLNVHSVCISCFFPEGACWSTRRGWEEATCGGGGNVQRWQSNAPSGSTWMCELYDVDIWYIQLLSAYVSWYIVCTYTLTCWYCNQLYMIYIYMINIYICYTLFLCTACQARDVLKEDRAPFFFVPEKFATVDLQLQELKVSKEELGASRKVTFGNPFFLMQRGSDVSLPKDRCMAQNFEPYTFGSDS